jgi:hypothetical protein
MIRHEGRFPSRLANDLRRFYAGADNLWTPVGFAGAAQGMTGDIASPYNIQPSGLTCLDDCSIGITGYLLGSLPTAFQSVADALDTNGLTLPRWNGVNFWGQVGDITPYTTAANAATTNCDSPCSSSYTAGQIGIAGTRLVQYNPNASAPDPQFFGFAPPSMNPLAFPDLGSTFAFSGVGFGPGDLLKRMKGLGATCVDARAEFQFSGLSVDEWSLDTKIPFPAVVGGSPSAPDLGAYTVGVVNGVTVRDYERNGAGTVIRNDFDDPGASSTSGSVSFVLMGKAPRSASVDDINGNPTAVATNVFESVGGGITATGTSGSYKQANVTGLINALLNYEGNSSEFFLFPSVGNPLPGGSGFEGYLESLAPVTTFNASQASATTFEVEASATGRYVAFTGLAFGLTLARFRLPSGIIEDVRGPLLIQPRRA